MVKLRKKSKKNKPKKSCNHIVKRKGHVEEYDERKVYASVYSAAVSSHYSERDAERLANDVMKKVNKTILGIAYPNRSKRSPRGDTRIPLNSERTTARAETRSVLNKYKN